MILKELFRYAVTLLLFVAHGPALAASLIPGAPDLSATSYALLDYDSGQFLVEHDAKKRLEPASLTKMLTAYTVFHELHNGHVTLDEQVLVSERAWRMPGSRMFIESGSRVSLKDLLLGLIIQSGNDASVALAEHVAGTEDAFAHLMNQHARRLGMVGSHFVNSTGLPHDDHYTTARDMARLAIAVIRDDAEYYPWYAIKNFTYNNIAQYNRNKLLWRDDSVDGIKTGHTESAGYCLVASAMRDQMRLIAVVMGASSEGVRASEAHKLLNYGFRFFETHRLYVANDPLKSARIWKGEPAELPLGLAEDLYVTIPRGQYDRLSASMTVENMLVAPVRQGDAVGEVSVQVGDDLIADRPLVALQEIGRGGLFTQLVDHVMMMFQ